MRCERSAQRETSGRQIQAVGGVRFIAIAIPHDRVRARADTGTDTGTQHTHTHTENTRFSHALKTHVTITHKCERSSACANMRCVRSQLYLVRHTHTHSNTRASARGYKRARSEGPPIQQFKNEKKANKTILPNPIHTISKCAAQARDCARPRAGVHIGHRRRRQRC